MAKIERVSIDRLCDWTGWTQRRIQQLASEGYFPASGREGYELDATLRGIIRYFHDRLKRVDMEKEEKGLLAKEKRIAAQRENRKAEGELIEKAEVGPALRNISIHQRSVLQRKLETELAPKLPGRPYSEIQPLIAEVVDELCQIFRDGTRRWMEDDKS